jgi:hypothetical protein
MATEGRDDEVGAKIEEIGYTHEDMTEEAHHDHETELFEAFGDGSHTPIVTDPKDGLPRPADNWVAPAPKLTLKSLICLEDSSSFVEVFEEDSVSVKSMLAEAMSKKPEALKKLLDGKRSIYDDSGNRRERREFKPEQVVEKYGYFFAEILGKMVPVAPRRQQCIHLVRQVVDAGDLDAQGEEVRPLYTYCKAFKSTAGSYLSLMDRAVFACEHRSPRDMVSDRYIRERIKAKVKQGEDRVALPAMRGEVRVENPFEGEIDFEMMSFEGKCDPIFAPGKKWTITVMSPSKYMGLAEHMLYVGAGIDRETFVGKRKDLGFHTLLMWPTDFAPEGTPPEDLKVFCEAWPRAARFTYLEGNLERTPKFLKEQMMRGESVAVCAKDPRDAAFAAALLIREFDRELPEGVALRPEHASYLRRTKKVSLCQKTKGPREPRQSPSTSLS